MAVTLPQRTDVRLGWKAWVATYQLYLESGPRKQKTMVHALDLLGCVANGPTTDAALVATPDAIRAYLRFLGRHHEAAEPDADFTTTVADHVMEGQWLGNGSPQVVFRPDLQAVTEAEAHTWTQRLLGLRAEVLVLARPMSGDKLAASPDGPGRSIEAILRHILGASRAYMGSAFGRQSELWALTNAIERGEQDLMDGMARAAEMAAGRLLAMTAEERARTLQRGKEVWTARKMFRRMLEHEWEHLMEISQRLGIEGA